MDLVSAIGVAGSPLDKFGESQFLFYKLNQKADIISTGITWAIVQFCGLIMVDDLPAAADQLSPPWARATQLVQWCRSSGRRGRLHVALVTGEGALAHFETIIRRSLPAA